MSSSFFKHRVPEGTGGVADGSIERIMVQVDEGKTIAFDDAGALLHIPWLCYVADEKIDADQRIIHCARDMFKEFDVFWMYDVSHVDSRAADGTARLAAQIYHFVHFRDAFPSEVLPRKFVCRCIIGRKFTEFAAVAAGVLIFFVDQRADRA